MLEVSDTNSFYDMSHILHNVSLSVGDGSLVTLIGRNGAGKSTTLKSIIGLVKPRSGSITFKGEDITGLEPHQIVQRGIAYIPEHRELFPQLTVRENLRLGHLGHEELSNPQERLETVYKYFPRLKERSHQTAGSLSGGEQQMVAIGRGMISNPELLLIDEPTEGLMPTLVEKLKEILVRINREEDISILLVEQNVSLSLEISDYAYIIDEGEIKMEGESSVIAADKEIQQKYLAV